MPATARADLDTLLALIREALVEADHAGTTRAEPIRAHLVAALAEALDPCAGDTRQAAEALLARRRGRHPVTRGDGRTTWVSVPA